MSDATPETPVADPAAGSGPAGSATADDFERYALDLMPDLLRYFVRRVPADDAEDCLSESLAILWRRRTKLPGDATDRRAWAYGVARKVAANHRRKLARRREVGPVPDTAAPAGDLAPAQEQALAALAALNQRDRELIRLVIWDGFGVGEAGRLLGLGEATARSRYARAKARLRSFLAGA